MRSPKYFLILGLCAIALLLSRASFAQVGPMSMPTYNYSPRVPAPAMKIPYGGYGNQSLAYRDGAGEYQLLDGSWHSAAKMVFDGERLTVRDSTGAKHRFTSEIVQQLVVKQDTFLVVKDLPGRRVAPPVPDFLFSCVNRQSVRLLVLYHATSRPTYFLSRPHTTMQLLPAGEAEFKKVMVAIVKDSPALSTKVASGEMGRDEVVRIVREYADFLHASSAR